MTHLHWSKLVKIKNKQQLAVRMLLHKSDIPPPPLVVTLTRIGPKKLDDDNLETAFKYVRDQIAHLVGVDDGSPLYTWGYRQKIGDYNIDIEITQRR